MFHYLKLFVCCLSSFHFDSDLVECSYRVIQNFCCTTSSFGSLAAHGNSFLYRIFNIVLNGYIFWLTDKKITSCFTQPKGITPLHEHTLKNPILFLEGRAKELAETIGADAISLADLETFHPEGGMVLANTTSIGMQPNVHETPVPKVASHISYSDNKIILLSSMHVHLPHFA